MSKSSIQSFRPKYGQCSKSLKDMSYNLTDYKYTVLQKRYIPLITLKEISSMKTTKPISIDYLIERTNMYRNKSSGVHLFSVLEKQSIDCSNPRISSFYPRISLTESAHRPCATINSYIIFSAPKSLSHMGSEAYFDVIDDEKNNKLNHLLKMRVAGEQ